MSEAGRERAIHAVVERQPIDAAWVFGSAATETMGPLSDVDIGLLASRTLDDAERLLIHSVVSDAASKAWGVRHVDVVFLDEATIPLAFAIISGKRIFCRDEDRVALAEARVSSRYHDRLPYLERHWRETLNRIAAGGPL